MSDGSIENNSVEEFNNRDKKFTAVRFDLDSKTSEYFNPEGENVKKAFLILVDEKITLVEKKSQ